MTINKQIPQNHKVNIDLVQQKKITCECGNKFWQEVVLATKVPGIMVGGTQDQLVLVKILQCIDCKKIFPDHIHLVENNNLPSEKNNLTVL